MYTINRIVLTFIVAIAGIHTSFGADQDGFTLEGTVLLPGDLPVPQDLVTQLRPIGSPTFKRSFVKPDGSFKFYAVPDGEYLVETDAMAYAFPLVKISVHEGEVHAIVPEFANKPAIAYPLRIAPLTQMQYFEQRKPFSLWAWLKTPYGLMIGFMVFSLVVMPMLKVDPEEYAQMLEEKKKLTESFTGRGGNGNASRKERR